MMPVLAALSDTYNYALYVVLMMIGFYGVIAKKNLIKQALGLGLFSTGIFLFYISMGVIDGGTAPVWFTTDAAHVLKDAGPYDNPLSHVLILTAIVVSVSSSRATTLATMPTSLASAAVIARPVNSSSLASRPPSSKGWVKYSWPLTPKATTGSENVASSAQMIRSIGHTSIRPPAITLPCTSAIVGLAMLRQRQHRSRYISVSRAM